MIHPLTPRAFVKNAFLEKLQQELTAARMELIDSKNKSEHQAALTKVEETEKELDSQLAELRRAQGSLTK